MDVTFLPYVSFERLFREKGLLKSFVLYTIPMSSPFDPNVDSLLTFVTIHSH